MKKHAFILKFILPALLIISLSSCSEPAKMSCRGILGEMLKYEISLPAGRIYSLASVEGEREFTPESLINSLYGGGKSPVMRDGWIDGAMFLSLGEHPCEFAVFLCDTHDTATDTARLLCTRINVVKSLKNREEYALYFENAIVRIDGNYVFLIISSDSRNILKEIKGMV